MDSQLIQALAEIGAVIDDLDDKVISGEASETQLLKLVNIELDLITLIGKHIS